MSPTTGLSTVDTRSCPTDAAPAVPGRFEAPLLDVVGGELRVPLLDGSRVR